MRPNTDQHNPLVSIKEFSDDGKLQIVHAYGNGGFRIAKQPYSGHQLVFMRQTLSWDISSPDDITISSLQPIIEAQPELILFGLGEIATSHLPEIRAALAEHHIKMDVMNTPAACRTWNVLLTEGRKAAAALVAID